MAASILLVDDDQSLREVTQYHLAIAGYEVFTAKGGLEGFELFKKHKPTVVISDILMPDIDGIQLLQKIKGISEETMVIIITAHSSIESAVEAMKKGACDYIEKPFSSEAIKLCVDKALHLANLERENRYLREVVQDKFHFDKIVGSSKKMQEVLHIASLIAPKNSTVLLLGETGTGKELLAKAIHLNSKVKKGPFVPVNMGAIPESLVDSELFGHEKGAFTGAVSKRTGAFRLAEGGTLFLDEVAEMRPDHQVRLLRVLQEREILSVGGSKPVTVNIRVIAATNQDLLSLIEEGKFREDLYYRLSVVPITLPPLRDRSDDIPLLVDYFFKKICNELEVKLKIDVKTMRLLETYHWPGNIRELENTLERCVALCESDKITTTCLPEKIRGATALKKNLYIELPEQGIVMEDVEKDILKAALIKNNFKKTATARFLGITRNTLLYRIEKYGLEVNKI